MNSQQPKTPTFPIENSVATMQNCLNDQPDKLVFNNTFLSNLNTPSDEYITRESPYYAQMPCAPLHIPKHARVPHYLTATSSTLEQTNQRVPFSPTYHPHLSLYSSTAPFTFPSSSSTAPFTFPSSSSTAPFTFSSSFSSTAPFTFSSSSSTAPFTFSSSSTPRVHKSNSKTKKHHETKKRRRHHRPPVLDHAPAPASAPALIPVYPPVLVPEPINNDQRQPRFRQIPRGLPIVVDNEVNPPLTDAERAENERALQQRARRRSKYPFPRRTTGQWQQNQKQIDHHNTTVRKNCVNTRPTYN
jgi:hypothetical protein